MAVEIRKATAQDLVEMIQSRLETLRAVNDLPADYPFSEAFVAVCRSFFEQGNHTTALALEDGRAVGCATLCYLEMMPTFSHLTGKRAYLMNVYTRPEYRRQGIAQGLLGLLLAAAREKGVTEISLDTTAMGKPLYEKCGLVAANEYMVLHIR